VELAELVSESAMVSELVSDLVLVVWAEEELAQGCQGSRRCCCKTCWGLCCRDRLNHLMDKFHNCWRRPNYSSSTLERQPLR
jgi:hypothetical protein